MKTKVTVGIEVTRFDSEYVPFEYRMFWCKQRTYNIVDWASEEVHLLAGHGGLPGVHKMQVGESRRYWVKMILDSYRDYWGEYYSNVTLLRVKRSR